jgi:large repetitive protein
VDVTIDPVNDDPVADDDSDITNEDDSVTINVLNNDTDPESDNLSVDSITQGSNGSVVNNGTDVTYTPDSDYNGTDNFTYTVSDGNGGTDTATVTVTVDSKNDAPSAENDSDSTNEDTAITIDVLSNDTDPDLDTLSIDSVAQGSNGTVTNNGTDIEYTPNADFNGTDSFTYNVSDSNGGTDTATVNVTIDPVNDDPVADDDSADTDEETSVTIDVLNNDTDTESDDLSVESVTQGTHGSVVNNGHDVTYTPDNGYMGTDSFTYTVSDGNGGADTATVNVTIDSDNDNPVAESYTGTTPEHNAHNGQLEASDPDNDTLSFSIETDPGHGSVVVNSDGSFEYTPDDDHTGLDTFEFRVDDGNGGSDVDQADITTEATDENITGTANSETLYGLGGNDTIRAGDSNDTLYGDSPSDPTIVGNDQLYGENGDDSLIGGPGNDTMWGDAGADSMDGGAGADVFRFTAGGSDAAQGEQIDGGADSDTLYVDGYNTRTDLTGITSITNIETLDLASRYTTAKLAGSAMNNQSMTVNGTSTDVNLEVQADGSAFDLSNMSFSSWDASDEIYVIGTSGNDTMTGTVDNDSITGDTGDDVLNGAGGIDTIHGDEGDDTIDGDAGNDTIWGDSGADDLSGGAGDDVFRYAAGGSDAASGEQIDGGANSDTLYVDGYNTRTDLTGITSITNIETLDLASRYATAKLAGSAMHNQSLTVQGTSTDVNLEVQADGSAFDLSNMSFSSWDVSDEIYVIGTSGNDTMTGTVDNDSISGDVGDDVLNGAGGIDTIHGEEGDDTIDGDAGNDTIWGDSGADNLSGGAGDDVFRYAAGGSDAASGEQIDGGADSDTLYVDGYNTRTDLTGITSITNIETLEFASRYATAKLAGSTMHNQSFTVQGTSTDVNLEVQADGSAFDLSNMSFSSWDTSDKIYVIGTSGNDTMTGTVDNDSITGDIGDDVLNGAGGIDTIHGEEGDDTIDGGAGNDIIWGNAGADDLSGGGGDDQFRFTGNAGDVASGELIDGGLDSDTLYLADYNQNIDFTDVGSINNIETLDFANSYITAKFVGSTIDNKSWIINSSGTSSILEVQADGFDFDLSDMSFTNWDSSDDINILGTSGNDSMTGTADDDSIKGYAGDDIINGSGGNDTIWGGCRC